ncbi:WD40 domain-containing protein, partial [Cephalotus follicularis]
ALFYYNWVLHVAPYNRFHRIPHYRLPKNSWFRTLENQFKKDTNNGLNNSLVVAPEDQARKGPNYGPKNSAPLKHENPLKKSQPKKSSWVSKPDDGQRRRSFVWTRGGVGSDDRNNKKRGAVESEEECTGSTGDVSDNTSTQKDQNKVCRYWVSGNCVNDSKCGFLHSLSSGDSLSVLAKLEGHEKAVTGIALPVGTVKLYSGSLDGTVRIWDYHTGHCARVIDQYDKIGSLINEGRWVFVGMPNHVKALNIENSTEFSLEQPFGQVNAMMVANDMLFAGTQGGGLQDGVILAWKGDSEANPFQLAASMNGHTGAVICLTVGSKLLYSGSMDHTIRVWDLDTLHSIMTLHGHSDAVMSLLCWDKYLSCSLDQTIKVWGATEEGNLEAPLHRRKNMHVI